ncbi:hypothetical protein JCM10207_008374 [Rhodosporidiobolus poonsookiae]
MNAHHQKRSYRPPPPKSTARFASGTFERKVASTSTGGKATTSKLSKVAERVPFGWQFDAVVPSVGSSSSSAQADALQKLVEATGQFYLCEGVNLADLFEPEFLNSFVRQGSLVALSLDDDESADVVAIDGRGRLVLSVPKDTYELLGLPGRASAFGSYRQRFIIEISLIDPAFRPGKPGFERVKRLLRDWPVQTDLFDALASVGASSQSQGSKGKTLNLVMAFTDAEGSSQPISFPPTITSRLCHPTLSTHTLSSIRVPRPSSFPAAVSPAPTKRQRTSSGAFRKPIDASAHFWDEYREWAGLLQLGEKEKVAWREGGGEEEEEWGVGLEDSERGQAKVLSWTGLLHPKVLARALESTAADPAFSSTPFLSFSLKPFPHAPLSHLSAAFPPVVGTSKKPNGKKRKRGRGRGEEEEASRERMEEAGGWDLVIKPSAGKGEVEWYVWEGQ